MRRELMNEYIEKRLRNRLLDDHTKKIARVYCEHLLTNIPDEVDELNEKTLLCGAKDWYEYSWGGLALVATSKLADLLLRDTQYKRYSEDGEFLLNRQAEALKMACDIVLYAFRMAKTDEERNEYKLLLKVKTLKAMNHILYSLNNELAFYEWQREVYVFEDDHDYIKIAKDEKEMENAERQFIELIASYGSDGFFYI